MRKTPIAAVLVVCLSGCSWIFVQRLPKDHDGNTEPQCTTSSVPVVLDALVVAIDIVLVGALLDYGTKTGEDITTGLLLNGTEILIHGISGIQGNGWIDECQRAKRDYSATFELRSRESGRRQRQEVEDDRGFFCTASPVDTAIGACNRNVETCEVSQGRLVAAGHDVGPCVHADGAMCFATLIKGARKIGCAPTVRACERQREWAMDKNPDAEISACRNGTAGLVTAPPPDRVKVCFTIDNGPPNCFATLQECEEKRGSGPTLTASECEAR